jgi:hypothetical protein
MPLIIIYYPLMESILKTAHLRIRKIIEARNIGKDKKKVKVS